MTNPSGNPQPPLAFGATVYIPQAWSYADNHVPCPVCFGKLCAVVILGNGEHVTVECDACNVGYDGPSGWVNEPCAKSRIDTETVEGFAQNGDQWDVLCARSHRYHLESEAFATREDAEAKRAEMFAAAVIEAKARAYQQWQHKTKKLTWLVSYHRGCLKKAQHDVEYHGGKLSDYLARKRAAKVEVAP